MKKFIFSKFAGFQAYSRQLYYQMNSFTGIFWQHFKLPNAPLMFRLKRPSIKFWRAPPPNGGGGGTAPPPPTMFATPVENLELRANIRSRRAKNAPKLPSKYLKNHTIFELYTDDNTSKYSSNPKDLLKSAKIIMKLYTKWKCTATTTEAVSKISNIKKISNKHFNLSEAEISIDTFQMN